MSYRGFRRKQLQRPIKIDLKMDLENFGPITKGSIKLKPLTIFVGPNNSGKSYAAMLIHSLLSSESQINTSGRSIELERTEVFELSRLYEKEIKKIVKANKGKQSFSIPVNITKRIFSTIAQDIFSKNLESTITRNFASPVTELIRSGQKSTKINISNSTNFSVLINKKLKIKNKFNFNTKYKFNISLKDTDHFASEKLKDGFSITTIGKRDAEEFLSYDITDFIIRSISRRIKNDSIPADSYYFPAARSGILQGHKALSASIIKSAPFGGIESFQIPTLTGVVSDFISNIILIPRRPGPFYKLASELESELLHGRIRLPTSAKGAFPEITYRSANIEIPLHRTSSTVSEIAPFSLYLKHIVYPSSMLIIEEPEAHLHPTNQLIFAKYLVKMIRAGLNVLITTHSVFLLEQLGKFMLASKLDSKKRKSLGFDEEDYLLSEEVSPYVFVRKGDNDHHISPIETNDQEGISQEEFVKVNELLYSESVKLQQNLPEN